MRKNPAIFAKFIKLQVKYYKNFLLQTRHFWQDKVLIDDQSDTQLSSLGLLSLCCQTVKPAPVTTQAERREGRSPRLIRLAKCLDVQDCWAQLHSTPSITLTRLQAVFFKVWAFLSSRISEHKMRGKIGLKKVTETCHNIFLIFYLVLLATIDQI